MSRNNGACRTAYYNSRGGKAALGLLTCSWVDISSLTTVGFSGEQADRVGSYTSASASPGDRPGFDWTPVWIFQARRCLSKSSTLCSGLCSLNRVWFGMQSLQALSDHFLKLCVRPEALCCPYFHTPTLYSIFLVVEPFEDEGSLGWAGEHPHCTGAHRSPLHPNSDIEEHKRAEIPGLPDRRLHYAHSPALYD